MIFKMGDTIGKRFWVQIMEPLAKTGNAELYLGKLCGTELLVVIKAGRDFIEKEYEILRTLRHPGIVRVLDYACEKNFAYMVMPYYSAITLEDLVLQCGEASEEKVLYIGKQLCEILCYLQERDKPILHNDIKPSNMLLQEDGQIVLLDFGLACFEAEKKEEVLFQGSLGYAAPECWHQGECVLSKATDVFAFGATLYRLLTGKKPSDHYGKFVLCDERKRENWQSIINKCCTLEARYRYQNAAQVLDVLSSIKIK